MHGDLSPQDLEEIRRNLRNKSKEMHERLEELEKRVPEIEKLIPVPTFPEQPIVPTKPNGAPVKKKPITISRKKNDTQKDK